MYFLTVFSGDEKIRNRIPYVDYAEAIAACGDYYEPKALGAQLLFTSVVMQKKFMRAYATLTHISELDDNATDEARAYAIIKQSNAFDFLKSYDFLIESEAGVLQSAEWAKEDEEDEE